MSEEVQDLLDKIHEGTVSNHPDWSSTRQAFHTIREVLVLMTGPMEEYSKTGEDFPNEYLRIATSNLWNTIAWMMEKELTEEME